MDRVDLSVVVFLVMALGASACRGAPPAATPNAADPTATSGQIYELSFDEAPAGALPQAAQDFTGHWAVRAEADSPSAPDALCQTETAEFPAIVLGEAIYADMTATVRFKPISGQTDQAAGIIFHVQDSDNYYILRANALENNVNFYRYAGGQRSEIQGSSATVPSGQWQMLTVEARGPSLIGYLNDQLVVEAADSTFESGRVGLWTKADSQTCFDDFRVIGP